MNQKGSLSLSMYAIVLAVIAIVVVALALVFVRNVFVKMSTKVTEAIDAHELVNPPTGDTPVTLTPPEYVVKQGGSAKTTLAFLNVLPDRVNCRLTHSTKTAATTRKPDLLYSTDCYKMNKDQINSWSIVIDVGENADIKATIFTIKIECHKYADETCSSEDLEGAFTKDLVIRVKE